MEDGCTDKFARQANVTVGNLSAIACNRKLTQFETEAHMHLCLFLARYSEIQGMLLQSILDQQREQDAVNPKDERQIKNTGLEKSGETTGETGV